MRAEADRVATRVRNLLGDDEPSGGSALHDPDVGDPPSAGGPGPMGASPPGLRQRLAARFPLRLDPGRRTAAVVGVGVLIVAIGTGAWLLADRPQALAVRSAPATRVPGSAPDSGGATQPQAATSPPPAPAGATSAPASAAADVVVDVAGKVRHPGVYRLPVGSRVDDAVRAAGGALPGVGVNGLNLAARVVDGQQIPVGITAAAPLPGGTDDSVGTGGAAAAGSGKTTPGAPVDINTATLDQLQTLPGVGPVLAQHILDWRTAHGHFASVDELNDVSGIGNVKFAAMRPLVTV